MRRKEQRKASTTVVKKREVLVGSSWFCKGVAVFLTVSFLFFDRPKSQNDAGRIRGPAPFLVVVILPAYCWRYFHEGSRPQAQTGIVMPFFKLGGRGVG